MVIPGQWNGKPITISIKPNCITVSIDDPTQADVFSYDLAGRMWTAFIDGIAYRRGLDGKMLARWRNPGEERSRRWLSKEDGLGIEARGQQKIAALYAAIQSGQARLNAELSTLGAQAVQNAIAFDRDRSLADSARYFQVYKPVGILPPDQYMSVVLQAADGCSFNTCTFCTFYRDRPFRIKTPDEFRVHCEGVRDFLAEGLSLRRTLFLGDANALVIPMKKLLPLLDIVHEVYDVQELGGIYAFLDGFSGDKKSVDDFKTLRSYGLKTIYIGMESGNAELLRFLKKPGTPDDVVNAVRAIKAAGLGVGVIILLGAGGHQYAAQHVRDTIDALNSMPLDLDDIVYFSELFESDTPYAQDAIQAHLKPLSHEECLAQQEAIESELTFTLEGGTPHISRYDIREFIY